jgi:hypothetical protein
MFGLVFTYLFSPAEQETLHALTFRSLHDFFRMMNTRPETPRQLR